MSCLQGWLHSQAVEMFDCQVPGFNSQHGTVSWGILGVPCPIWISIAKDIQSIACLKQGWEFVQGEFQIKWFVNNNVLYECRYLLAGCRQVSTMQHVWCRKMDV